MKWKKTFSMVLLLIGVMLSYSTLAHAAETYDYKTELKKFPSSYQSLLEKLHDSYPEWVSVAVDTGLNWDDVIENESVGTNSFLQTTYADILLSKSSADYNAATGKYVIRDGLTWVNASDPAIAYFADPRNYLNKQYIFAILIDIAGVNDTK